MDIALVGKRMQTGIHAGLLAAAVGLLGLATPLWADGETRQIVVTGEGRVSAAPDMAVVRFGVTAQAPKAQSAMDEVSEDVREIFQTVVDYGIAPRDIQTTSLRLDPLWNNRSNSSGQAPEITGFVASNEMTLRLRDMASLGAVLQSVLDAGANRFSNISFTLSDPAPLRNEARRAAVADARAKAELYAEAAGVSLGDVLTIMEAGGASPRPVMMAEARMAMDSAVPVAGGELDLTARVTITYELK